MYCKVKLLSVQSFSAVELRVSFFSCLYAIKTRRQSKGLNPASVNSSRVTELRLSPKRKPSLSNPTSACQPRPYISQNSVIVRLAVGGEEGGEGGEWDPGGRCGGMDAAMASMLAPAAKKGGKGYGMPNPP